MNIEQANAIPLIEILGKIGHRAVKHKGYDFWFFSPLREEKTPSFHIHARKNVWYDFGANQGGDPVNLACAYLKSRGDSHAVTDGLQFLKRLSLSSGLLLTETRPQQDVPHEDGYALILEGVSSLKRSELLRYVIERGIPIGLAKKYLTEAFIRNRNTGKMFFALSWLNEDDGYELRNKVFKGCIGSKSISFIKGAKSQPEEVNVFEGMMDFLAALAEDGKDCFDGDSIILNSVACLPLAFPYIKDYSYERVRSWLDNDSAGMKAAEVLESFTNYDARLLFKPMNRLYLPHKDVNAWRMNKLAP